jgi:hypothetical protein
MRDVPEMSVRRRIGLYEKSILPKRKRYAEDHRCIDCGNPSPTCRCNLCNQKQSAYMREWRRTHPQKEIQRRWRDNNRDKIREFNKKSNARQYGLSLEQYEAALKEPCGICGMLKEKMCIDHDHNTNKVRGTLCSRCNSQLGWFEKYNHSIQLWVEGRK